MKLFSLVNLLFTTSAIILDSSHDEVVGNQKVNGLRLTIKVPNMIQELNLPIDLKIVHLA